MRFLLIAVVLVGCGAPAVAPTTDQLVVAGALELGPEGWHTVGGNHESINVERVETGDERIAIHFTFDASKVVTFIVTPDNSLAAAGYTAGMACYLDRAEIELFRNGERVPPSEVTVERGNLLFYGLLTP